MLRTLVALLVVAAMLQTAFAETGSCTCTGCGASACAAGNIVCAAGSGTSSCNGNNPSCDDYETSSCDNYDTACAANCADLLCTGYSASCGSPKCFPAHATVQLEDGTTKTMSAIQTGDRVLVGSNQFSDVYMFSHRDAAAETAFIKIHTAQGHTLMLTSGHYLYINSKLAAAKTVRVGDLVTDAAGKQVAVTAVSTVRSSGLYNPHTMQGDIVVDGLKTSSYTEAIAPALAHAALWPVRMAYSLGQDIVSDAFAEGSELIANALPNGQDAY